MSTPTRDHRPCPKCGATIGRQPDKPALCQFCGTKLRARMTWVSGCDCGWQAGGFSSYTRAREVTSKHLHVDEKGRRVYIPVYVVICDCGWEYGPAIVTDCRFQIRYHRQAEHTP